MKMTEAEVLAQMKKLIRPLAPEGLYSPDNQIAECENLSDITHVAMLWGIDASHYFQLLLEATTGHKIRYDGDEVGSRQRWPFVWHQAEYDVIVYG